MGIGRNAARWKHFRLLEFAVPELTRSADIKLNAGVLLRRLRIALSSAGRAELAKTAH